jgi:predicted DNA-binding WGR domain protein
LRLQVYLIFQIIGQPKIKILKLVKQVKLFFQEGTSDKVYEIDLCESGDGFIVNFRYGRRGAALKDGTKTIFPVALAEAEKVFAALEQEKRKKGYVAAGEAPIVTSSESRPSAGGDKRKKAIVKILKAAAAGEEPETWRLSRVIWRAGDLKIKEAMPQVVKLANAADPFNIYSVVWALGRCGSAGDVPFLQDLLKNTNLPPHVRQLVYEVLLKYAEGAAREKLLEEILQTLPGPIRKSVQEKNFKLLNKQLREYLFELKTASNEYLVGLYQLSRQEPALHAILLNILDEVPLSVNYFKHIRHIFKAAEMLEDYSTYGVIAKNIERKPSAYKASRWMNGEQKAKQGFSNKTKAYLALRVQRFLRNYGEAGESSYTELATEVLLAFNDARDMVAPWQKTDVRYQYDATTRRHNRSEVITHFDCYASFRAFNYILYKNSPRYVPSDLGYKCVPPFEPGQAAPTSREEAYPHLWDKAGEEIVRLLSYSQSQRVHEFALKVFAANSSFESLIEMQHIVLLVQAAFVQTQQLGLKLARRKYDRLSPDKALLIALLESPLAEARDQGVEWIQSEKKALLEDSEFVVSLLKIKRTQTHEWLRTFLSSVSFAKEQGEVIAGKAIVHLITLDIETDEDRRLVRQLTDTLVAAFSGTLRFISLDIIKDMFRHPSEEIHALAGKILLKHEVKAENLPEDFLQVLLQSGNANTRGIGISLLGQFPNDELLKRKEILVSFCLSPLADVRTAVKPLIFKLVQTSPEFGKELIDLFVPAFLMKESYEGVHDDLLSLLANELSSSLSIITKERTLLLLNSKFKAAQQMGWILVKKNLKEEELTVTELVKMASNPGQDVRLYAWDGFKKFESKIKAGKEDALRLTDSDWDDTRLFAFDYFRNRFTAEEWTTDLLVSLCDSVRDDVQAFGREMITKFFKSEQGTEYLLKLSQHPNTKVQLFATAYLEQHAGGNWAVIQTLKPYFITLLSQVNKGRVAKIRVMEFLRKEALRNEEVARFVADILVRVSVSVAIGEKAGCIALLRDIQNQFPGIQSPLLVKQYSDYIKA